jgi:hypothetical protein
MHTHVSSVLDVLTGKRVAVLNLRIARAGKGSTEAGLTRAECVELERRSRTLEEDRT